MSITQLKPEVPPETPTRFSILDLHLSKGLVEKAVKLESDARTSKHATDVLKGVLGDVIDSGVYDEMCQRYVKGDRSEVVMAVLETIDPLIEQRNVYADSSGLIRDLGASVTKSLATMLSDFDGFVNIGERSYMFDPYCNWPQLITHDPDSEAVVYLSDSQTIPGEGRIATAEDYARLIIDTGKIQGLVNKKLPTT